MNLITKTAAGIAVATLLVPTIAFGHEGEDKKGLGAEGALKMRIEHKLEKAENREHREEKREDRWTKNASTTAAAIIKKGQRIQLAADTMLSFDARIASLIASSSVEEKAGLEALFAKFKTSATSSKTEAQAAINTAAQINASNSTTTNANLFLSAKTDLKEAKGFLHDAKEALFSILRSLWN